ncbi:hypothetical protein CgunFtcFv8_017446 [Champsocephalus gunnari]|uniref:Uncharacterized protein n=1 Tax=Champsocephalus gunnari TaxID=52237 RepID=A0AAN8DM81_CHAGU|nr:hypothetical protein CgunFtcFv8_017446 [Champsocephalus gunnari]
MQRCTKAALREQQCTGVSQRRERLPGLPAIQEKVSLDSRDLLKTVEREEMICSKRPSRMVAAPAPERIMPAHIKHLIKNL